LFTDLSTARFQRQRDIHPGSYFTSVGSYFISVIVTSINRILITTVHRLQLSKKIYRVELYDSRTGDRLDQVHVDHLPESICMHKSGIAAVTIRPDKVKFINVKNNKITLGKELKVKPGVSGITNSGDNLAVSYDKRPWLEVISTEGKVLHQFKENGKGQHFKRPDFLTSTNDGCIYVSDWRTDTITKLDGRLNLLQTFTTNLLHYPRVITAVCDDQLIVCTRWFSSIDLLRLSTGKMSRLLGKEDGLCLPRSVSYCHESKTIYVGSFHRVKVYAFM